MEVLKSAWIMQIIIMLFMLLGVAVFFYVLWLTIKALKKYLSDKSV
jgi:uncharacterized protein YneF (UPF0154 family)